MNWHMFLYLQHMVRTNRDYITSKEFSDRAKWFIFNMEPDTFQRYRDNETIL